MLSKKMIKKKPDIVGLFFNELVGPERLRTDVNFVG